MKKTFTLFSAMLMSIAAFATNYSGTLTVTVNGEVSKQPASVVIDQVDGKYNLSINNFMLIADETTMPVGLWVRRTAEEVLLTFCPPAPLAR